MSLPKAVEEVLVEFRNRRPQRAGSLIVTVFGDAISQHGNSVWLGSLIAALEPFGLNDRMIRTSVFRLAQDGWLQATQVGRRSYYSFTESGLRHYEKAARRIYAAQRPEWNGEWTLVLPTLLSDTERDLLRKELSWLGYGLAGTGLMARPGTETRGLRETLTEMKLTDKVVVMSARTHDIVAGAPLRQLAQNCWKLDELEQRYQHFLQRFEPVLNVVERAETLEPEAAFLIRLLLIHEYRRILLKDTDLPRELLPKDWDGETARQLTATLYRRVYLQSEIYLRTVLEAEAGELPEAVPETRLRFGGI